MIIQPNPPMITRGLVHHWPLNEGSGSVAHDAIGGYDGTIYNGAWAAGELVFNGTSTYVALGALPFFAGWPLAFTVEITPSALSTSVNSRLLHFNNATNTTGIRQIQFLGTSPAGRLQGAITASTNAAASTTASHASAGTRLVYGFRVNASGIPSNWINGVEVANSTTTVGGGTPAATGNCSIGNRLANMDMWYAGSMKNMRIYAADMTDAEMKAIGERRG